MTVMDQNIIGIQEDFIMSLSINDLIINDLNESELKYLADTEAKHFVPEMAAGSLFTELKSIKELLEVAKEQREQGIEGDDRDQLISMGVPENALLPQCRYLVVKTKGEVGIVRANELPADQLVYAVKMKLDTERDGKKIITPASLVTGFDNFPIVDFGVIIVGPRNDEDPSKGESIWTCHPGLPIRPKSDETWKHGETVTAGQVEAHSPGSWLNVKRSSEIEDLLKKYNF